MISIRPRILHDLRTGGLRTGAETPDSHNRTVPVSVALP